ncbi:putative lanthionine synthetase C [Lupinus albus]|uniref:Putative lanthionine synthetase C n=1 Tax=Lupinus albus TaxID=3870 RepID=A0A6A4Q2E3_LUPAL|nr:putative lanthionine synthetase C [Lupinus albus]
MTSSVFEDIPEEGKHEPSDLITETTNLTATNLSLPNDTFLRAAISLKDQVVEVTWNKRQVIDPTVYSGLLGTAFTCLRSYQVTSNHNDLLLCAQIVHTCSTLARASLRHVTFLCGRGGVYAIGAVVANYMGDSIKRDMFLDQFIEVAKERALPIGAEEGGFGMSYDLLYGRAGFLWGALYLNKYLGEDTIPNEILMPIIDAVMAGGRAGASDIKDCPLMYRWHGTRYLGAANGLAGILHVLLHFPLSSDYVEDIKGTLRYLMSKRFPHSGNYPSSEGNPRDKLVQWSHGATGMAITLSKAAQVFPRERDMREAAIEAGEVVWKNGLLKKVGLADGVSGNAYAFLSLFKLTKESIYEDRAKAFSYFLYDKATAATTTTTSVAEEGYPPFMDDADAYSLFQGHAGTACLWFDLLAPHNSTFPGYEL